MNLLLSFLMATLLMQRGPVVSPPPKSVAPAPASEAQAPSKYQIGAQDQLKITVLDEADLSTTYRVDADGTITLNYIGKVQAGGLTLPELQERLTSKLAAGYLKNPQVRVEIESYKSQSVLVSGEVRSPGKIPMTGSMTVLEALASAGSPTSTASSELTIARKNPAQGPDASLIRVNWKDLQLGKGTDVALQDQDILNVPKAQTFFITGQIHNSGSYVLEPGTTVQQAIAMAGGLSERGSDRRITASRLVNGKLTDVDLKMEDRVVAGDTITIKPRFF